MHDIFLKLDKELLMESERVLEEMGLDVVTVVRMMLKRLIKENDISFIINKSPKIKVDDKNDEDIDKVKMTKNKAINLFKMEGCKFNGNITFATKNKSAYNYWANPSFDVLDKDWFLILNDNIRRELYLFLIPKNSIKNSELVCRGDKKHLIDLQIMYEDNTFTDTRSKISLVKYLIKNLKY